MNSGIVMGELYLNGEKLGAIQEISFEECKREIEEEYEYLKSLIEPVEISFKIEPTLEFIDMIYKSVEEIESKKRGIIWLNTK